MQTSINNKVRYPWWAGNARLKNLSGTFLTAHIGHAAVMAFGLGALTLWEVSRYSPNQPMYEQGLFLLPRLATQGWSASLDGQVLDTAPFFAIGVVLLVSSAVLAAGSLFHRFKVASSLEDDPSSAVRQFHFSWEDSKKLGFILGNNLIFLGLGALLLAAKGMYFGGLYDATIGSVRVVSEPTLNPFAIANRITHLFSVNSLEDVVGGHIYVGLLLVSGGIWHIVREPFEWVKWRFIFAGNAILSYSLFGLAVIGFVTSFYCGFNTLAYPSEFYGPQLQFNLFLLPHFYDPAQSEPTTRVWLANAYFYLAFFLSQGAIWHFGLDSHYFEPVLESWRKAFSEILPNPNLAYQQHFSYQPQPQWDKLYELSAIEQKPAFAYQQPSNNHIYEPSKAREKSAKNERKPSQRVLYDFSYPNNGHNHFYESSNIEDKSKLGYPQPLPHKLYEFTYQKNTPKTLYASQKSRDQRRVE